jgi:hypothetical protein
LARLARSHLGKQRARCLEWSHVLVLIVSLHYTHYRGPDYHACLPPASQLCTQTNTPPLCRRRPSVSQSSTSRIVAPPQSPPSKQSVSLAPSPPQHHLALVSTSRGGHMAALLTICHLYCCPIPKKKRPRHAVAPRQRLRHCPEGQNTSAPPRANRPYFRTCVTSSTPRWQIPRVSTGTPPPPS